MCYIELKNEKYETLEDLKRLLHYILRLDKTAEDSQRANTITNTLAGCQPAMIPNEYLCDPSSVYHLMLFEVRRRHKHWNCHGSRKPRCNWWYGKWLCYLCTK